MNETYDGIVPTQPDGLKQVQSPDPWLHGNLHMVYGGSLQRGPDVGVYIVSPMLRGT